MAPVRSILAAVVALINWYRKYVSPLKGPSCRFYPSCSAYAVEAIQVHQLYGTWLAAKRVARCHPWHPGGVDMVPPASPLPTEK